MEESIIVKGKRIKQQRRHLLPPIVSSVLSPTTSAVISESPTEEEEDIANCLILLARGGYNPKPNEIEKTSTAVNITSRRFAEPATTAPNGKSGNNDHQCRDCNMSFSSHNALSRQRANHNKKPKLLIPLPSEVMNLNSTQLTINSLSSPATNKVRIHQCRTCGNEFSSGQALGGHMRKHRSPTTPEPVKKKNSKRLNPDLNIPPPRNYFEDGNARENDLN